MQQQPFNTVAPQRFKRKEGYDSRLAQGSDFDGDAWQDTFANRLRWVVVGTDPNSSPEQILVIKPTCKHCGSDEVILDGNARWDLHLQDWHLEGTHDGDAYCCQCCDDCHLVDVATPAGSQPITANVLTRAEVMAIFDRTGDTLSFSDVTQALAARRDAYDLAAVQAAQKGSSEGDLEVDENALTSRANDDEGCYVMAWAWVPAPESSED